MEPIVKTADRIANAAADRLRAEGIAAITVASVGKAAGVSTALVHYHFASKQRLLGAAAERLCADRTARRARAFAGSGLAALDAVWLMIEAEADGGDVRAWHDLVSLTTTDVGVRATLEAQRAAETGEVAQRLPALLRSLGAAPRAAPDELATLFVAVQDGAALALASGAARAAIRSAFDAFCLVLISAGPTARR